MSEQCDDGAEEADYENNSVRSAKRFHRLLKLKMEEQRAIRDELMDRKVTYTCKIC